MLVSGGGKASATGQPLGNKFFLKTGGKCTDKSTGQDVDRYIYINNVPVGNIPFISSGAGVNFSEFKGLIPGTISNLNAFNPIKVRQPGAKFSQEVWKAMRKIPAGKTLSYAELEKRAGSADAIRAAGTACGNNLIAPIIPCHRIIKSGGALGNYGYGIKVKEWLLTHEGAF